MEKTIKCCCGIVVEHEEGKDRMLDNVKGLTPRVFWAPVKEVCKMRWLTKHDQKNAIFCDSDSVYYYYGLDKNNFQSLDATVLFLVHGVLCESGFDA